MRSLTQQSLLAKPPTSRHARIVLSMPCAGEIKDSYSILGIFFSSYLVQMKNITAFLLLLMGAHTLHSQHVPLLNDATVDAFHSELSGESAKRNLEYIVRLHRMRGSSDFQKAVDFIAAKLKEYNLEEVETFYIPADGKSMYGTQKSRLAWDAEFAELWELEKQGEEWKPKTRLADWESMPITLAEDSESCRSDPIG